METINDLEKKIEQTALAAASSLSIIGAAQYEQSGPLLRQVIDLKDQVHATFDPIVSKANATHKEALAQRKRHLRPLEEAERRLKGARGIYVQKQEAAVREERRQLELKMADEACRRRAEAEAYRREADEEAALILQEAEAKAALLREKGEMDIAAEALEEGEGLAATERREAAEVATATETTVPKPMPVAEVPTQKGHSYSKEWRYEIINMTALKIWLWHNYCDVLAVDGKQLRALVRTQKEGANGIPGLRVYSELIESVRRK